MTKIRLTEESKNKKLGKMPTTTTERKSCPDSCRWKNGDCYGEKYHTSMIWKETETGINKRWGKKFSNSWNDTMKAIKNFPESVDIWRHNQIGDLPNKGNDNESIDEKKLDQLVKANNGRRVICFTHKHSRKHPDFKNGKIDYKNIELIKKANDNGFTMNLSANDLEHADELAKHGLPVAVVVDEHTTATPDGRPVAMCLSQTKGLTCKQCKLCSVNTRKTIVGFLKH